MPAQIGEFGALQAVNKVSGSVVPTLSANITGSASAGSSTSVTGSGFTSGALVGKTVWISAGTGAGSWAVITANTTTVITVAAWLGAGVAPASGSTYNVGPTWVPGLTWFNSSVTVPQLMQWNSEAWVPAPPQNGVSTTVSTDVLTDSTKSWITNQFAGYTVTIVSGTGVGSTGVIASNTSTALTVSSWSGTQPATGCGYTVCNRYLALLTTDPTTTDGGVVNLSDGGFVEYSSSDTGYARQPVYFNQATSGYPSSVANTNLVTFGPFSPSMTTSVSWVALVTVPTGTTGYYLADWFSPVPMQVENTQSIQIGIGELVLQDQ